MALEPMKQDHLVPLQILELEDRPGGGAATSWRACSQPRTVSRLTHTRCSCHNSSAAVAHDHRLRNRPKARGVYSDTQATARATQRAANGLGAPRFLPSRPGTRSLAKCFCQRATEVSDNQN
jgi:hypothetical protein